jgi:hypothetical protein
MAWTKGFYEHWVLPTFTTFDVQTAMAFQIGSRSRAWYALGKQMSAGLRVHLELQSGQHIYVKVVVCCATYQSMISKLSLALRGYVGAGGLPSTVCVPKFLNILLTRAIQLHCV